MNVAWKKRSNLLIGFCAALLLSALFLLGVFSNLQLSASDSLYGGRNALSNVVIVAIDDLSIQEVGRWPWDRSKIAAIIDNLEGSKIIAIDIGFFEESSQQDDALLARSISKAGNVILAVEGAASLPAGGSFLKPISLLSDASLDLAYINVITDRDGVTRSINPFLAGAYQPLSAAIYRHYWGSSFLFSKDRFLVNFVGVPGSFQYISAKDVLSGYVNSESFKDKIVIIGATAPDLHDDFLVPTSKDIRMPGVEVHANAVQTLINHNELVKINAVWTIIILVIFSILVSIVHSTLPYKISIPTVIAFIFLYAFAAIAAFNRGFIVDLIYPPIALILSFVANTGFGYLMEKNEKAKVILAFGKYVSPVLVKEILAHPEKLKLGGEKRHVTVLFSDVRGFTSISEKLSPEELVSLLNGFLSDMTDIILEKRGLVDKYMGDAIMALWNAPLDDEKHAENACTASLEMIKQLKIFQNNWTRKDIPALNIGIGINTGPAVVGNMGSHQRFDYTAMGDTINLGSRLEGLTKQYGVNAIISQSTHDLVKERFLCRKLDKVAVKGKKEGIVIFELICSIEDASDAEKQLVNDYEHALELYLAREFSLALDKFRDLEKNGDSASKEFIHRCEVFIEEPHVHEWDGVWVMKTK